MAEPTVIECTSACTVTVVHEISIPPFQLDTADAGVIAAAVLAVWAVGFGFRALIQTLKQSDGTTTIEE